MDFWRTLQVLGRGKWILLLSGIVAALFGLAATRLMKSTWSARVTLMLPPPAVNPSALNRGGEGSVMVAEDPSDRIAVYEALLKTRRVLKPALETVGSRQDVDELLKDVSIESDKAGLFALEVKGKDRDQVGKLANALAASLETEGAAIYGERVEKAVHILEGQLRETTRRLSALRRQFDQERRRYGVLEKLSDHVGPALERYNLARRDLDDAEAKLAELAARLGARRQTLAQTATLLPAASAEPSKLAKRLEDELADAEWKLTVLRARYTDEVGEVKVALASRDTIRARLQEERNRETAEASSRPGIPNPSEATLREEVSRIEQDYQGQAALTAARRLRVDSARSAMAQFAGADGPLADLAAVIAERNEERSNIQARLLSARMAMDAAARENPLVVLDQVSDFNPPINTTAGRKIRLVLIGTVAAVLLTAGGLIGLDVIDRRLRTLPQAEVLLPGPIIAAVPQPAGPVRRSDLGHVTLSHPLSPHAEAYHFLASHLDAEAAVSGGRIVMLNSARPGWGSAQAVANLGITLAQTGKRVILVDLNFRKPMLHSMFGLPNEQGVSNILDTANPVGQDLPMSQCGEETLYLMPAGNAGATPWELLHSPRLAPVLRELRRRADVVIVDTACGQAFSDAFTIAGKVDSAILCTRAQEMPTGREDRLARGFERVGAKFLGTMLFDVPVSELESYRNFLFYLEPDLETHGQRQSRRLSAEL